MTLEAALEYIEEDELVEVTPDEDPPAEDSASEHERRKERGDGREIMELQSQGRRPERK